MARPLRLEFPGALFHVLSRGNEKQSIFVDDRDRARFLDALGECVPRFGWILHAYALMPNHFHLLVQLTTETLSKGMHWLNGTYAMAFNQRHNRVGHVLQGRFKSPLVEKEAYLLQLIRYIVLNPVRAGIVARPEDDRWTSYRATIGLEPAPDWLAVDDVLRNFGIDRRLARAALHDFVNAAIGMDRNAFKALVGRSYLGTDDWIARIAERIELQPRSREHSFDQRFANRPSISEVIAATAQSAGIDELRIRCGADRRARMLAAWIGWKKALLTGPEIAAGLRVSCSRISQLVRSCDREIDRDDALRAAVSTISRKLKIQDLTPAS